MPRLDPDRLTAFLAFDPAAPQGFVSSVFLVFVLVLFLVYPLASRRRTGRVMTLLVFSLYFYYRTSGLFLGLLVLSTLIDFGLALALGRAKGKASRRAIFWTGVVFNLAVLVYFRYSRHWLGLFQSWGWFAEGAAAWALPVGISFYTFQKISYLADVLRGRLSPIRRPADFLLYVVFFPRVIAGPIVRGGEFFDQLDAPFSPDRTSTGEGLGLILTGLFKKAVIADFIGVNFVDRVFAAPGLYSGLENLLAVYGYAVQIYCDFSGYTDIALGLGRMLGLRLPPNFRSPYKSVSVSDFWRRWHITLSRWLRDYLFLPLAYIFSRRIKADRPLGVRAELWAGAGAALLTWFVCGVWHGAAWGFVIWGLLHGLAISIENIFRIPQKIAKTRTRRFFGRIFTFHYICLAWIFFRADKPAAALAILSQIFKHFKVRIFLPFLQGYPLVSALILLGFLLHFAPEKSKDRLRKAPAAMPLPLQSAALALMIWIVFQFLAADIQPFIYFRF